MAEYLIQDTTLTAIADAIRTKSEKSDAIPVSDMATEIMNIPVGGASLNYSIVGSTTQPSNPTKNMIWVNTDVEINNHTFSPTEPTDAYNGLVWFETDTTSDVIFNAFKENVMVVSLSRACHYINGAFNPREAYLYNGTSWVNFSSAIIYLYIDGDTCDDITGGYFAAGMKPTSNPASDGVPSISYGESSMTITGSNSYSYNGGYVRTQNKIDLTDFSKLKFEGERSGVGGAEILVWTAIGSYIIQYAVKREILTVGMTSAEIDISDLTGEHYVGFMTTKNNDGSAVITVKSFGLE